MRTRHHSHRWACVTCGVWSATSLMTIKCDVLNSNMNISYLIWLGASRYSMPRSNSQSCAAPYCAVTTTMRCDAMLPALPTCSHFLSTSLFHTTLHTTPYHTSLPIPHPSSHHLHIPYHNSPHPIPHPIPQGLTVLLSSTPPGIPPKTDRQWTEHSV